MDIRKFFSPINQKKPKENDLSKGKKRKIIIESDEEDPLPSKAKTEIVLSSDSDDEIFKVKPRKKKSDLIDKTAKMCKHGTKESSSSSSMKSSPKEKVSRVNKESSQKSSSDKLKPVSAADFFGSSPVIHSRKQSVKKKTNESNLQSDDAFEKTLEELDKVEKSKEVKIYPDKNQKPKEVKISPDKNKKSKETKFSPLIGTEGNENSPPNKMKTKPGLAAKLSQKMKTEKPDGVASQTVRSSPRKRDLELNGTPDKKKIKVEEEVESSSKVKIKIEEVESSSMKRKLQQSSPKKSEFTNKEKPKKEKYTELTEENVMKKPKMSPSKDKSRTSPRKVNGDASKTEKSAIKSTQEDESDILPVTPDDPKKQRALAYRKFLQRGGPKNPGGKPLPEGTPTCLSGLTFVVTGTLETLDREETSELIKKHGGRVTTSISKKTSYLVVGDDAGESKLTKANQLNTKILHGDDELFNLIRELSDKGGKSEKNISTPKSKVKESIKSDKDSVSGSPISSDRSTTVSSSDRISSPSLSLSSRGSTSTASPYSMSLGSQSSSRSSQSTEPISSQDLASRPAESLMWVDKYKPVSLKNIVGQQGYQSNAKKLLNWLKNWAANQSGQKKLVKPSPWSKDNTGAYFKAALLSGPPGVGKTTTATLVCKELGFDAVELNASDARSKKKLTEEVSELLLNKSLSGFVTGNATKNGTSRNHVLLMDEVDGMAGNEDRGGVQELIAMIKGSKVPIICMCNDRNHQKIRSLANHCFDLRFNKPRIEQIRSAMLSICFRENIKVKPDSLDQMIIGSNQDIRQVLHHLSMWSADQKVLDPDAVKRDAKMSHKEFKIGPWDVCTKVFSESAHKDMSIHDKVSLFFHDYSIGPLFVQENYLKVNPHCTRGDRKKLLEQVSKTASVLADSDVISKAVRKESAWSLLPTQAVFSSVCPGEYMSGHFSAQVEFPKWLGNNSRRNKFDRMAQEIQLHTRLRTSGSKLDILMDYATPLRDCIVRPLSLAGSEGVSKAVEAMSSYDLLRDDLDSLLELSSWPGMKDPMTTVETKVKSAFTRTLNKEGHLTPFSGSSVSKKVAVTQSDSMIGTEDQEDGHLDSTEEDDDEDISKDNKIKVGKSSQKSGSWGKDGPKSTKNKGTNTKQNKRATNK